MTQNVPKAIDELLEKINNHRLLECQKEWNTLQHNHREVIVSGTNLASYLQATEDNPDLALEMMKNITPNTTRNGFFTLISRDLTTLCASLTSIVDHSRRIFKKHYPDTLFFQEWNEKTASIIKNPSALFLRDLRNYLSHFASPPWTFEISHIDTNPAAIISLNKSELLKWDGWKPLSLKLINETQNDIYLLPIVKEYLGLFQEFWVWVFSQFEYLHEEDIKEFDSLQKKQANLMTGGRLDSMIEVEAEFLESVRELFRKEQEENDKFE